MRGDPRPYPRDGEPLNFDKPESRAIPWSELLNFNGDCEDITNLNGEVKKISYSDKVRIQEFFRNRGKRSFAL